MILLETVSVAFSMFSALPVPHVMWDEKNMRYALCAFPLVGVAAGALSCLAMLLIFSLVMGFDRNLTVSILPKGITAAIGVSLTELFGGTPSITTLGISVTGICLINHRKGERR